MSKGVLESFMTLSMFHLDFSPFRMSTSYHSIYVMLIFIGKKNTFTPFIN